MRIDRPNEDDAPVLAHDSPAAERDSPDVVVYDASVDLDAERAAYGAGYRGKVAAEYRAAWDEAVPAFHETWKEIEKKYPDPERARPTVEADGSWRAGDVLKLSPEQNAGG